MKTPISLVYEDDLSGCIIRKILKDEFQITTEYNKHGFGGIKKKIQGYNNASMYGNFFVLTDLDTSECAPLLIKNWLHNEKKPNLIFRVAEKEIESWVMADRKNFALFLGISKENIPVECDKIDKPKEFLLNLVKKSKRKYIKEDMLPKYEGDVFGPDYTGCLSTFINDMWSLESAVQNSKSLNRAVAAIKKLQKGLF